MAYTHSLTDTEIACGVTLAQVRELRPKILVTHQDDDRRVVVPEGISAALAASTARCALGGATVEFAGLNWLGQPVYRPQ